MKRHLVSYLGVMAVLAAFSANASAGVFKTITIDDAYGDWVGVPVADSDASGEVATGPDIGITQIANDNDNLYIRNSFFNATSLSTFTSIDVDENPATGFDVFGLGLIGAEAGWQNDFGFEQAAGVFNSGALSGPNFGGGHAIFSSFAQSSDRELSISLSALFGGGGSIFPDDSFTILIWTNEGDVSAAIPYTLATAPVPEPSTVLLMLVGGLFLGGRRRR